MSLNVDNCPRCGKIYVKGIKDMCPACVKEIDQMYDRCVKYLRDNRGATLQELSEATDVTVKQITRFIREGRISLMGTPNLGYPCEVCGTIIREGGMCESCRQRLAKDIRHANEEQARKLQEEQNRQRNIYNIKDK